ncbi:sodium-dependent phosphate transport protein 1 [Hippopotamus amphibius kiboko]|uniref:sodium-dependent phosphate transport protein 1 n=1 Tax=Hippopotamus amphibius kiboko TaxID=575201 RepID=UPI002595F30A|nr:sodium-dependent phosphate transport protein 1 [Hippopotamus amphibius kiboko]XP_057555592.1 sodium-dependent phosphate transport protein 1 [Hippopotamus amphibius kiboko]XP_057555593.1 sodium-dependent phosphate transport protein 1 [Hippopotamus amphibius kiboko]XP_057555594.1 sodium-dependent phosphate transport protein 1 [Hippopotamus amphibius kiboko]XP_057555595.1 sodium-dependent phosphate transport protein 1 [Hippopotamus amphibius kiboko]
MQMDNQVAPRKVPNFCSIRYIIAILLLLCNVITMSQRVCMSLTMIAMVNSTEPHGLSNTSTKQLQDNIKNPVYNWSTEIQGIMLSSIFYGVLTSQVPAGYLSGIYSLKKLVGSSLFFSSLFTLLIPPAAEFGEVLVILCRVIQGLFQGITLTSQQVVWIKWAPPLEHVRLNSLSLSGLLLGPCIVLLITGFICDFLGWPMVFYIFGAVGCALSLLWFILFYEDPKDHPCISISEKEYIMSTLIQQVSSRTPSLPIKAMLKCLPLWVISLSNFAFFWTNSLLSLYIPMLIDSMFHVGVKENGLLSSLPHLFAWIFAVLAGHMADVLLSRNILSLLAIRKLCTLLGFLLPALFSLCLLYLNYSFYGTMIFLILTNATGSFNMGGILINILDIAPRYYGFLRGFTNVIGLTGGLVASTVTGMILSQDEESPWFKIFFLMIAINVISLIFYLIFAKAEVQDWAKERQTTYL